MTRTLLETMDYWMDLKLSRGKVNEYTAANQSHWMHSFAEFVGPDLPLDEVTSDQVERWLAQLRTRRGKRMEPSSANTIASPIRAFFTWCHRRGFITSDPCVDVDRSKVPPAPPRALSKEQVAALIDACPDHEWRAMVVLTVNLGLRIGDLAKMRVEHWDRRAGKLTVVGKGGRTDDLDVVGEAAAELAAWVDHGLRGATSGPMWPSRNRGARPDENYSRTWIGANLARIGRRAGIDMSAHALRHTTATMLSRDGVRQQVVQRVMRHASPTTTARYAMATADEAREALERQAGYIPAPAAQPVAQPVGGHQPRARRPNHHRRPGGL